MSARLYALSRRREHLVAQSALQRARLANEANDLRRPFALADRALRVVHFVRSHPVAVGLVAAAIVVYVRPRGALRWLGRGLFAYRMVSGLRKALSSRT